MQTLAELKAENAAEEAALAGGKTPEQIAEEARIKADSDAATLAALEEEETKKATEKKSDDKKDDSADSDDKDDDASDDTQVEEWLKPGKADDDAVDDAKFTDSDAAAIRRKWKGKVNEQKDKISVLEQEIQELKKGQTTQQQTQALKDKPKRTDFEDEDAFLEALTVYTVKLARDQDQSAAAVETQKRRIQEQEQVTAKATDAHYLRAHALSKKSNITAEAYQAADLKVREAIESVFPEAGDKITDALIANLGPGSEKVFFHIGVNAEKRAEMVKLFQEDKTGIKAAVFLGRLNEKLNVPAKRESSAPAPLDDVTGDKKGGGSNSAALRKDYDAAHKKGDTQGAYNIKQRAKAAKIDTSTWASG